MSSGLGQRSQTLRPTVLVKKLPTMNVAETLQSGLSHHRAGRFSEARRCYEAIFNIEPNHARALEMAGLASLALRQTTVGIAFLERAVNAPGATAEAWLHLSTAYLSEKRWTQALAAAQRACGLKPDYIEGWCAIGMSAERLQNWDEAISAYRRAVLLRPAFAEVFCNLGGIYLQKTDFAASHAAFARALELKPGFPEALNGLGVTLKNIGELDRAETALQQAIVQRPAYPEALYNLGNVYQAQEKWAEATAAYRSVLILTPQSIEALHNLGCALCEQRAFTEAADAFRHVLARDPLHADAANHLGNALLGADRPREAMAAYEKALALRPDFPDALCNLGNAYLTINDPERAIVSYRKAEAFSPNSPAAEFNTGIALLVSGRWAEGFPKYERRWDTEQKAFRRSRPEPLWLGQESLAGKTILLHSEQGLGDTLQFVRYAPLLAERGAKVILQVQEPLKSLLLTQAMLGQVYSKNEVTPTCDYHCPFGSLPLACKTEVNSVPSNHPYIYADASLVDAWKLRLGSKSPHIGLVCSGNARHKNDHRRSIPLAAFTELSIDLGSPLHLVQKDFRENDREFAKVNPQHFINWSAELDDFRATAALVAALDLIITVDTSAAHLAGALGKPCWLLLPYAPDWRWLLQRTDSPWYPSMRLFRQPTAGDWASVLREVSIAIKAR